jgi:hypothetical protein
VVRLDSYIDRILLSLDDSTGVVECCLWTNDASWTLHRADLAQNALVKNEVKLGDLVRVFGKIHLYTKENITKMEINIHTITLERDPNMETLHWLDIMTLDREVYRRPFVVPDSLSKLSTGTATFKDLLYKYLGFSVAVTQGDLESSSQRKKRLPKTIKPFSEKTLLKDDWVLRCAEAASQAEVQGGRNISPELALSECLKELCAAGDIIEDPKCSLYNKWRDVVQSTGMTAQLSIPESELSEVASDFVPTATTPYILVSSDLLGPIIYDLVCTGYSAKVQEMKPQYGVGAGGLLEGLKETHSSLRRLKTAHVEQALDHLVDLDLIYEVAGKEYKPLYPASGTD